MDMIQQLDLIASNIERNITETKKMTATPGKGVTRLPFTLESKHCVHYIEQQMTELGLQVKMDESGAVIGTLPGVSEERIMIGSHYDSVEHGGAYDGMAGILCGIEVAAYYIRNHIIPPYTLEIVGTNDEEGARFGGGYFSSKAFLGKWSQEDLQNYRDQKGISYYEAMNSFGLEPERLPEAKRSLEGWKGFIEVHVEQGSVLENAKKEIGVVSAIVAMERCYITVQGKADHAGTQPMDTRTDALMAGMELILELKKFVLEHPGMVGTVGEVHVFPNEINIVPEKLVFSVDIRATDEAVLMSCKAKLKEELEKTQKKGFACNIVPTLSNSVTKMNPEWIKLLSECADELGFSNQIMHSGAGHDAAILGKEVDTAMLFVPSIGGRSHIPEENSDERDLAKAVLIIIDFLNKMKERQG